MGAARAGQSTSGGTVEDEVVLQKVLSLCKMVTARQWQSLNPLHQFKKIPTEVLREKTRESVRSSIHRGDSGRPIDRQEELLIRPPVRSRCQSAGRAHQAAQDGKAALQVHPTGESERQIVLMTSITNECLADPEAGDDDAHSTNHAIDTLD